MSEEVKETKKATRKPKKKTKAQIRKILKEAECLIVNNNGAQVYYRDNHTGDEFELFAYGDTDIVEVETLRKMHSKHKDYFEKYWILIVDVFCDDDSIEVEDVYDYIGIAKLYQNIESPNQDFFDEVLLEKNFKDFKKMVDAMNKKVLTQLFNRAAMLYQERRFSDTYKIGYLEDKVDREYYFRDLGEKDGE